MRKYKRHICAKLKKLLPAVLGLMTAGSFMTAQASDAVSIPEGTEGNLSTAINPEGNTIDRYGIFGSSGTGGAPPIYFFAMSPIKNWGLNTDPNGELTKNSIGDYAYLVNNGVIRLSYKEIADKYGSLVTGSIPVADGYYYNVMGRGLQAGTNSTVINNGAIYMVFDEDESTKGLFFHALNASNNSSMINNGTIEITGQGSTGANVRALATSGNDMIMRNYGTIYMDVGSAELSRSLANTGQRSLIENYGTIYNRSHALIYGMAYNRNSQLNNFGKVTAIVNAAADKTGNVSAAFSVTAPGAMGLVGTGGNNYTGKSIFNSGIVDVQVMGAYALPTTAAADFLLGNTSSPGMTNKKPLDSGIWYVENIGVLKHSSTVQPSAENSYVVRNSEIGINTVTGIGDAMNPVQAKIGRWTTELRDFGTTKDFIQVARHSGDSAGEYKYGVDFSSTNLILRPAAGYTAGTPYLVSANTLVTPVDGNSLESLADVTGMDTMTFSSEVADIIAVNAAQVYPGTYAVSLTPTNDSAKSKRLLNSVAMLPVDFTRASMDRLDYELETNPDKWFLTPYYTNSKRSSGMKGKFHGYIGGSNWRFGDKLTGGIHASYSIGNGKDGGIAYTHVKGVAGGLHLTYTPEVDKNWIRANVTYMHNSGDATFDKTASTGLLLNGKRSEDSNNIYAAINVGQKNTLSERDDLRSEVGLSYLNMNNADPVNWSYMGEELAGYRMSVDKYNALYATAKTAWSHRFSDADNSGVLRLGLGVRGRLSAKNMQLGMMNTKLGGTVREDPIQGLVNVSYNQPFNSRFQMDLGYQGVFGKDLKNHNFYASFNASF